MNSKQRGTLDKVFKKPPSSDIAWADIEKLFIALGAEVTEGNCSRIRVALNGVKATFHRPRPQRVTDKGAVKSVERFLANAGIKPTQS